MTPSRAVTNQTSTESLLSILRQNALVWEALGRIAHLDLPDWYLGAGCIAQTVWNHLCGNDPNAGIRDYDVVYFSDDLSEAAEDFMSEHVRMALADLNITADVKNQSRVHTWYSGRFGYDVLPYTSTADAISTWPTTATAVGVRVQATNLSVCAPLGVNDLLAGVIRPNRVQITPGIYDAKVERWSRAWPLIRVLGWEDGVGEPASRWIKPTPFQ